MILGAASHREHVISTMETTHAVAHRKTNVYDDREMGWGMFYPWK